MELDSAEIHTLRILTGVRRLSQVPSHVSVWQDRLQAGLLLLSALPIGLVLHEGGFYESPLRVKGGGFASPQES